MSSGCAGTNPTNPLAIDPSGVTISDWRIELPLLVSRAVTLREPDARDVGALGDLLSLRDANRFGVDTTTTDHALQDFIARAQLARVSGESFMFAVTPGANRPLVGLMRVRRLDPSFDTGDCEATLMPSVRGTGAFLEAARLVASFAFRHVGVHRLEARVLLRNGRANGALDKLGAVREGILRRSARGGDGYFDQVLWSILKEDWTEQRVSASPRVH